MSAYHTSAHVLLLNQKGNHFDGYLKQEKDTRIFFLFFKKKELHLLCNSNIIVPVSIVPGREWHGKVSSARNSMLKHQSRQRNEICVKMRASTEESVLVWILQVESMSRLCSKCHEQTVIERKVNHDKRHFDSSKQKTE